MAAGLPCGERPRWSTTTPSLTATAPKPLRITQPEGPTFQISGQEVRWQGWRLRVSVHPREGLVLHTVGYEDSAQKPPRVRPILYRASLSEMFVPYGDPDPNWRWRAARPRRRCDCVRRC